MTCGCNGHSVPNYTSVNAYNNAVNPVSYSIADVATGSLIDNAKWSEVLTRINQERARRGNSAISDPGFTGTIQASDMTALHNGINYYWSTTLAATGSTVNAAHINELIDKIQYSGSVCVCNCAYCTCNCNYCTCNCNYSCTCNCNYSDERLKMNIKFIGIEKGLNMYSWNYKTDASRTFTGVIAQELIGTKFESALHKDQNGFFMVDYSKLPVNCKEV